MTPMRSPITTLPPLALALLLAACASHAPPPAPAPPPPVQIRPPPVAAPLPDAHADERRRAEFELQLRRWHGADAKELRSKLGPPTSTRRDTDGRMVYVYDKSSTVRGPAGQQQPFRCVVGYVFDTAGLHIGSHWFEGC